MCFTVPLKIVKIKKNEALLEGGKTIVIGKDLKVRKGDYLRILGNLAIDSLTQKEGLKIRQLIKRLN